MMDGTLHVSSSPGTRPTHARAPVLQLPRTETVAWVAGGIVGVLMVLGIVEATITARELTFPFQRQFVRLFNLDSESNIPSMISVLGIGACAVLLGVLAAIRRANGEGFYWYWMLLAAGFVVMALDEGASIHDSFNGPLGEVWIGGYLLRWSWVLFAIPAVLVLGVLFIPFVRHLPFGHAAGMVMGGILYLIGAVGFEILSADEPGTGRYIVLRMFEEGFEMLGIAVFLVVLWSFLREQPWRIQSPAAAP